MITATGDYIKSDDNILVRVIKSCRDCDFFKYEYVRVDKVIPNGSKITKDLLPCCSKEQRAITFDTKALHIEIPNWCPFKSVFFGNKEFMKRIQSDAEDFLALKTLANACSKAIITNYHAGGKQKKIKDYTCMFCHMSHNHAHLIPHKQNCAVKVAKQIKPKLDVKADTKELLEKIADIL